MKQFSNYADFFSTIAKCFVMSPNFYEMFLSDGFDPIDWPDCEGKFLAMKFYSLAKEKGADFARFYLREEAEKFLEIEISEDPKELVVELQQFKTFGVWLQVSELIKLNPMQGETIIKNALANRAEAVGVKLIQEEIEKEIREIKKIINSGGEIETKIQNWEKLSSAIGGFNPGRIFLLVAGTGVGKTTFSLNLALSAIKTMPVLFINMEMSISDMVRRISMLGAGITQEQLIKNFDKSTEEKVASFAANLYANNNFFITDGRSLTIEEIKGVIVKYKQKHNVSLVFIDYDQKIKTNFRGEEWQAILRAVEQMEEIAKATSTSVMVLAQGDQSGDPKASKRSMQPASAVLSFFQNEDGKFLLESKKNRFGRRFKLELLCDFSKYKIQELDFVNEEKEKLAQAKQASLVRR